MMYASLLKIHYYANSRKVRRRGLVMLGDLFTYGNHQYTYIGDHDRQVYLSRLTTLGHVDIKVTIAATIGCEWSK